MREILFRGKRIDSGEWVYGTMYKIAKDLNPFILTGGKWGCSYQVDEETVGQCTGLKGKNGNKIFEGDILALRNGIPRVVRFENGAFVLENTSIPMRFANKFDVIGNVHDNPELLEK